MKLLQRTPAWRIGLTHIWCTGCGRDLDWAQPEFLRLHPDPVCARCPIPAEAAVPMDRPEPTLIRAEAEVIRLQRPLALEPSNTEFLKAVAEAEVMER